MARMGIRGIALAAAAAGGLLAAPALACGDGGCSCKRGAHAQAGEQVAAKCSCSSQADCTCKKGSCKCAKCSGLHKGGGAAPGKST